MPFSRKGTVSISPWWKYETIYVILYPCRGGIAMKKILTIMCFIALIVGSARAAGPVQFSCTAAGPTLKIEAGMFNLIERK